MIEFGEFVRSLDVFHPDTPVEEKIACNKMHSLLASCHIYIYIRSFLLCRLPGLLIKEYNFFLISVAFRLYDLRGTGFIGSEEVCAINLLRIT